MKDALEKFKEYEKQIIGFANKSMFKAMGFTTSEIESPRIAVVNSWSEQSPGHIHLRDLGEAVKAGIRSAGAMPFEFNVLGPCIALAENFDDLAHYDLVQREVIISSIEVGVKSTKFDGWVGLCTCDKIVPAMLIAAIRINKPCIIVGGGSMFPGEYNGHWIALGSGQDLISRKFTEGTLTDEEVEKISSACGFCAGACAEMTTGNTMQIITEGIGMSLPHSSTIPALFAEQKRLAKLAGSQVTRLARKNIKPSDIITKKSIENAIMVEMAVGGATNAVLHIQALAWEASIDVELKLWDLISQKVPTICSVVPSGPNSIFDLHKAGGVPAVMKEIKRFLNLDCLTVTEKTVGDNISAEENTNPEVIHSLDSPVWPEGAITVLTGNLAPRGAIVRPTVIENKQLLRSTFRAKVFNNFTEAIKSIITGDPKTVQEGDAVICRYEGPRGGPGMSETLFVVDAMNAKGLRNVAYITDGRFSGCTRKQLAIGHVCPEAQIGGPLAIVEDGDVIEVDIPKRRLELKLADDEIKDRFRRWVPPEPKFREGVLTLYAKFALQADNGGGWATRI